MSKIDELNFGILTEGELYTLEQKLIRETQKRKEKPEEYIKVIRADDGSEGFYLKLEDLNRIDSEELLVYIAQTLNDGSQITFSLEDIEKNEYEEHCKSYEWNFDQENNEN